MVGTEIVIYQPKGFAVIERLVRRRLWQRLRNAAAALPFAEDVLAAYYCVIDRHTPLSVKVTLLGALAGLLVPERLIPQLLKSLVLTGDIGFLLGAIHSLAAHIKPQHRIRARLTLLRLKRERTA